MTETETLLAIKALIDPWYAALVPVPKPIVPGPATGNQWILDNFASERLFTGALGWQQTTNLKDPALVKDATRVSGQYGIKVFNTDTSDLERGKRIAFVNVDVRDQVPGSNQYGAAIATAGGTDWYTELDVFMSNVVVEPNWPTWVGYPTTNYDGFTLDGGWMHGAAYLEDVTIRNWNADAAIDIKPGALQAVRLNTFGKGQTTLKFWNIGPHYLVDCDINNDGTAGRGALIECAGGVGKVIVINVYNSRFNGWPTVPEDKVWHSGGSTVEFVYLTVDPRTTGEMHPMFLAP